MYPSTFDETLHKETQMLAHSICECDYPQLEIFRSGDDEASISNVPGLARGMQRRDV